MTNINNLTIVIVTYKTNEKILFDCLHSINSSAPVLIVENSNNSNFKQRLENKYPKINVLLSGKNLGYGGGNNFGLEKIKTQYALILNPDVILENNFFIEINKYLEKKINFHIMGITYKDDSKWKTSGPFSEFDKKIKLKDEIKSSHNSLEKVDWVIGCGMLINLEKFKTRKLFDENFFLYFEEFDLCRRVKANQGTIYTSKNLLITHLGNKGSSSTDPVYSFDTEFLRNWHWMWSTFYYYRKYYGYLYAVYKTYGKLFRSLFKIILFTMLFNKNKKLLYYARALGLLNSMIGRKSWYRLKSLKSSVRENQLNYE